MMDAATIGALGSGAAGFCRTFVFTSTVTKAVWQPGESIRIIAVVKLPGSSVALVIAKSDITATMLATYPGGSQLGSIIFADYGVTNYQLVGIDVIVDAQRGEKVYLNWATTSTGTVLVYYRPL